MSRVYIAEGVVLKRKNLGEADRMLTVFTKQYGKIQVIAKGVRKINSRRAGHIEVFSRVVLTLHMHHPWDILTEAQALTRPTLFESNAVRMGFAYCMCELVDQLLADRQEHEDIYALLSIGLEQLTKTDLSEVQQQIFTNFVHNILWMLGFLPREAHLTPNHMQPFVERITERRLRTWPLLRGILAT